METTESKNTDPIDYNNPPVNWYLENAADLLKAAIDRNNDQALPLLEFERDGKSFCLAFFETEHAFLEVLAKQKAVFDNLLMDIINNSERTQSKEVIETADKVNGLLLLSGLLQKHAMLLLGQLKYS